MLRPLLAVGAFLLLGGQASAASTTDCRSETDSLLRLRCYDEASGVAGKERAVPPTGKVAGFDSYPAKVYDGPVKLPTFSGATKKYAMFRTRIRDGMREGANFAGHLSLIQFGCGTGCSVVVVGDVADGTVSDFPLGGEDVQGLSLDFR